MTLHDVYLQYSSSQVILNLGQSTRGHFAVYWNIYLNSAPQFPCQLTLFDGHKIPPNTRNDSFSDAFWTWNGNFEDWRGNVSVKQADFLFLFKLNDFILSSFFPKVWQGGDPLSFCNPATWYIANIYIYILPFSHQYLLADTKDWCIRFQKDDICVSNNF